MFGQKAHGPTGSKEVTRRGFLITGATFLGAIPLLGFIGGSFFRLHQSFYQKAWRNRNLAGKPVTVFKMVPLPNCRYANADLPHMANKIFPSIEAARARRQHKAFFYGLKQIDLPRPLVNGMDGYTLFCDRKDLDYRVRTDRRHWQRLGIDVDSVFSMVRNA
jgi:hypothetical protein